MFLATCFYSLGLNKAELVSIAYKENILTDMFLLFKNKESNSQKDWTTYSV